MNSQVLQLGCQPLICNGTPFERGFMQGDQCARPLQLFFNAFFQSDLFKLYRSPWLPTPLAIRWYARKTKYWLHATLYQTHRDYLALLEGIAAGAKIPVSYLYLLSGLEEILAPQGFQCGGGTALAIPAAFSSHEEPLLLQNIDYPFFARHHLLVRKSQPQEGLASLEVTLMHAPGCHSGLNEAGLAIMSNPAHHQHHHTNGPPLSLQIQEVLRTCQTVAEAVALLESQPYTGHALLTLQDSHQELYSLEISGNRVYSRRIHHNLLIHTNHFQMPEMAACDLPTKAYYPPTSVPELRGKRIRESSESRFDRLGQLLGTKVQFSEQDLQQYMGDHGKHNFGNDNTICRHGDYYGTAGSIILKPASRQLWVAKGNPCESTYSIFEL